MITPILNLYKKGLLCDVSRPFCWLNIYSIIKPYSMANFMAELRLEV